MYLKNELNFIFNTKLLRTDLLMGTTNLVVIRLRNRRKNILQGFVHVCSVLGPIALAKTEGPRILTTYTHFFNWSCFTSAVLQHMT